MELFIKPWKKRSTWSKINTLQIYQITLCPSRKVVFLLLWPIRSRKKYIHEKSSTIFPSPKFIQIKNLN
jgi:hypothetical protein